MAGQNASEFIHTAEQLFQAVGLGRCELIRGELTMMSPAGGEHGAIAMVIGWALQDFIRQTNLGRVFAAETGFILSRNPDTVRAPDVAFVSAERLSGGPPKTFIPGPPDLAVEVMSPKDTKSELSAKVADWLAAGCREVWVVDVKGRSVSIHRSGAEPVRIAAGESLTTPLLPGFSFNVAEAFET